MSVYILTSITATYPTSALSSLLWWRTLSQQTPVSQSYHQSALWCTHRSNDESTCGYGWCTSTLVHASHYYLLYGLQAAMNLISSRIVSPFSLLSHIISLISSIASEVLASSKNKTVSNPIFWFFAATTWTSLTKWVISSSVTPPWIYIEPLEILISAVILTLCLSEISLS